MGPDGLTTSEKALPAKAIRWHVDDIGRTIYYPFGPARHGYIVDTQRERALREADQCYSDRSNRLRPYAALLGLALTYPAKMLYDSHPLFALGYLVLLFALIVLTEWGCRYVAVKSALEGLPRAPAETGRKLKLYSPIVWSAVFIAALWSLQHLYDQRLAALPSTTGVTRFYPDISFRMTVSIVIAFIILGLYARRKRVADPSGKLRISLLLVAAFIFQALTVGTLALQLYDPKPKVIVTNLALSCGWSLAWSDVVSLDLRAGNHGKEYVRLMLGQSANDAYGSLRKSCEIDSLNADYDDVYRTIVARWQEATPTH